MDWRQIINVLKAHRRQWHGLGVGGMNFEKSWSQMEPQFSHSSPTMPIGQRTKSNCMQIHIKKVFVRIRKWNTLEANFSLPNGVAIVGASACDKFWFPSWGVYLGLGWTMAEGVNGVAIQIRSRNHKCSALMEELIFIRACVRSLGMGMRRYQVPISTRPIGRPPLIVFQILILTNGPLIC